MITYEGAEVVEVRALLDSADPNENDVSIGLVAATLVDFVSLKGTAEIVVPEGTLNEKLLDGFDESPEAEMTGFGSRGALFSSPDPPKLNVKPPPGTADDAAEEDFDTAALAGDGANEKDFDASVESELKIDPPVVVAVAGLIVSAADSSFFSMPGNLKVKVCGASLFDSSFFSVGLLG